ncbi:MAG TPA: sialidase family protein [Chloroflexota bacterium]|nr:sialidase family protein [Chloroflexota bacterium]
MKGRVISAVLAVGFMAFVGRSSGVAASGSITQISSDPFSSPTPCQHHTEVEPDVYSWGSTVVAAVQQGRCAGGGSTDPGWATYSNGSWQHGSLPGLTQYASPPGPYAAASDPAVVYDAKHGVWLIVTLDLPNGNGDAVSVNSSADGLTWQNPVTVATTTNTFFDKTWITCDNWSSSPHYGNCYVEFDDAGQGDVPYMATSSDGGNTWGARVQVTGGTTGLGGQPVVQPNGTVIVPFASDAGAISAFRSTDGGKTWGNEVNVATVQDHFEAGNLRSPDLPSAEIDGKGKVYVTWADCRFESGCSANDIVMSTSTTGAKWSKVVRIPIDPVGSGVDHFLPGLGVDRTTSGKKTDLALVYYYYPVSNCGNSCQLDVGYLSSTNAGKTWSPATQLAGPMQLSWLAQAGGPMVGDYMATTILNNTAYPVFVVANAPSKGVFDEALYSTQFPITGGTRR